MVFVPLKVSWRVDGVRGLQVWGVQLMVYSVVFFWVGSGMVRH